MSSTKEKIKEVILIIILACVIIFTIEPATYFIQDMIAMARDFVIGFEDNFLRYEFHPVEQFMIRVGYAISLDYVIIKICFYTLKTFPSQRKDILNNNYVSLRIVIIKTL